MNGKKPIINVKPLGKEDNVKPGIGANSGIVTILDEQRVPQVYNILKELQHIFDLPQENLTLIPHLTWHISESLDVPSVLNVLAEWAKRKRRFTARAVGLGMFCGTLPIVYIPVIKDPSLRHFHQQLWKLIAPLTSQVSTYYSPREWIPHITLAYGDIHPEALGCAFQQLAYRPIGLEIPIEKIAFGSKSNDDSWKIIQEFRLIGSR